MNINLCLPTLLAISLCSKLLGVVEFSLVFQEVLTSQMFYQLYYTIVSNSFVAMKSLHAH